MEGKNIKITRERTYTMIVISAFASRETTATCTGMLLTPLLESTSGIASTRYLHMAMQINDDYDIFYIKELSFYYNISLEYLVQPVRADTQHRIVEFRYPVPGTEYVQRKYSICTLLPFCVFRFNRQFSTTRYRQWGESSLLLHSNKSAQVHVNKNF